MPSTPLETVLNSTLTQSRKKLFMASLKSNALQAWAFATNRVEFETGGHEITNPLILGRNPNVSSYEYYDELPITPTSEFDTVRYGWSRVAGSLMISNQEIDENQGPTAIFKLVRAKYNVLQESMKEQFGGYMYGAGAGKDPYGLSNLIPDDPTTGVLGGIDRASEVQWRTSSYDFGSSLDQTNIEEAMDDVFLDLTMKQEKPDFILMGRNMRRIYAAAVRDKVSFALSDTSTGNRMADLGFGGYTWNKTPIVYDEDCPVDKMYLINSTYLRLHILRHVNMKVVELTAPWTVDAIGRRVVWQGQWCLWKAYRTHGVVQR